MTEAKDGDTVKVHYTAKLTDGTVFDTSEGREPLEVKIGEGQVLPEFEKSLKGMNAGDKKTFTVKSEDAYGPQREDLVLEVERDQIPEEVKVEVGQQLQVGTGEGQGTVVTVLEVNDDKVKLDANHPLAGKDLVFDIELDSVQ